MLLAVNAQRIAAVRDTDRITELFSERFKVCYSLVVHQQRSSADLPMVVQQFLELSTLINNQLGVMLAELGLTGSEGGTLWALAESATPVPMRDIARRLGCDPSNVTVISDKLQAAGLIERRPHPNDGRARVLALTADGRELWSRVHARLALDSPIATLTPADRRRLSRLLSTMTTCG